jgi:hypothetical protein
MIHIGGLLFLISIGFHQIKIFIFIHLVGVEILSRRTTIPGHVLASLDLVVQSWRLSLRYSSLLYPQITCSFEYLQGGTSKTNSDVLSLSYSVETSTCEQSGASEGTA